MKAIIQVTVEIDTEQLHSELAIAQRLVRGIHWLDKVDSILTDIHVLYAGIMPLTWDPKKRYDYEPIELKGIK